MDSPVELTLEQEFELKMFEGMVNRMTEDQAKDFLVKFHMQMIIREAYYRHILGRHWGICADK